MKNPAIQMIKQIQSTCKAEYIEKKNYMIY